jgi:Polyketide cyclase / dehydrase and lipid transport
MADPVTLSRSRTYPVPQEEAFAGTLAVPLEQVFDKRYGPLPPVVATVGGGTWGTVGQTRVVKTADGGQMQEELTTVDPPSAFGYELTDIQGPMRRLVGSIDGTWTFDAVGSGSRITWTWVVHPTTSPAATLALPVIKRVWQGYARQALDRLEALLLAG